MIHCIYKKITTNNGYSSKYPCYTLGPPHLAAAAVARCWSSSFAQRGAGAVPSDQKRPNGVAVLPAPVLPLPRTPCLVSTLQKMHRMRTHQ